MIAVLFAAVLLYFPSRPRSPQRGCGKPETQLQEQHLPVAQQPALPDDRAGILSTHGRGGGLVWSSGHGSDPCQSQPGRCWLDRVLVYCWRMCVWSSDGQVCRLYPGHAEADSGPNVGGCLPGLHLVHPHLPDPAHPSPLHRSHPLHFLYPGGHLHQQQCAHLLRALHRDSLPRAGGHHLWRGHLPQQPRHWTPPLLPHLLFQRSLLAELVPHGVLPLQPPPHPPLPGILRPPLPGCLRLCLRGPLFLIKTEPFNHELLCSMHNEEKKREGTSQPFH
ncbi:hypothetical protein AGOR_G00218180 [Albula goreensis]|uniref:Uncharacterized protein n=1 Tax=Albula goreensis TaxID=1534307 RepID=A0A8T3CRB7_9TELE|nr:hypothetical protein AGOR_G00218180 [Albula goreensis]